MKDGESIYFCHQSVDHFKHIKFWGVHCHVSEDLRVEVVGLWSLMEAVVVKVDTTGKSALHKLSQRSESAIVVRNV